MNSFWSLLDFCPCHSTKPLFGVAFAQERPGTDTSRRAGVTDSMGICGNNRHFCHLLILSPAWLQGAATQTTGRLRCCAETWVLRWDWNAPRYRGWGELRVRAERGDSWWHLPTSSGTARDATSPSVPRSENLPFSAFFSFRRKKKNPEQETPGLQAGLCDMGQAVTKAEETGCALQAGALVMCVAEDKEGSNVNQK